MTRFAPIVSTAVATVFALGPVAAQAEPDSAYASTTIEVDTSALGGNDEFEATMAELAKNEALRVMSEGLTSREVPVVESSGAAKLRVTVRWRDYETSHYEVQLEVVRDGTVVASTVADCKSCDETKTAEAAAAKIPELLRHLATEPVTDTPPADTSPKDPEGSADEPEADELPKTQPPPSKLGGAAYGGIAAAVAGIGLAAAGAVVVTRDPPDPLPLEEGRDTFTVRSDDKPLGRGLIGVGAGLLVAGVALIVVDQTVLRKRRERQMSLVPTASPTTAGLTWVGRF